MPDVYIGHFLLIFKIVVMLKNVSLLILIICSFFSNVKGQGYLKDASGAPMPIGKYVEVDGDQFLDPEWRKGTVAFANGGAIKDIDLKLDVVDSKLIFQSKKGEALYFVDQVKEFTLVFPGSLNNTKEVVKHFKNGYTAPDNSSTETFYQVLYSGTVELLKRTSKSVIEQRRYDSSVTNKSFQENTRYYLVISGKVTPVKNDKKSFLNLLKDKESALETYIKSNKTNFKSDADLVSLITYYNSI